MRLMGSHASKELAKRRCSWLLMSSPSTNVALLSLFGFGGLKMRRHTVEIGDTDGETFRIKIATPNAAESIKSRYGTWHVIDKGFVKFTSGSTYRQRAESDSTLSHLMLYFRSDAGWGIKLNAYEDIWGVNDQGSGQLAHAWAIKAKPVEISWILLD